MTGVDGMTVVMGGCGGRSGGMSTDSGLAETRDGLLSPLPDINWSLGHGQGMYIKEMVVNFKGPDA